jgi:hypothetical protein
MGVFAALLAIALALDGPEIDFDTEIIPILTRSGCNSGACHGAAAGRGGFQLSLLGGDAAADYAAIVLQYEGRRIHPSQPEKSLVLRKPTMELDHEGGDALDAEGAKIVANWIRRGAKRSQLRQLISIDAEPRDVLLPSINAESALKVVAHFDDGTKGDVSRWTVFTPSDPFATSVDLSRSVATVHRRGQHTIIARYLDRVIPLRISVPMTDEAIDLSSEPSSNFIDEHVNKTLQRLRLPVSAQADDSTWVRRLHLDLVGRLPSRQEAETFLSDSSTNKREVLIDRLLQSEAFVDYWTYRFSMLLRVFPQPNDKVGALTYHRWIQQQLRDDTPIDAMARTLLLAVGDTHQLGAANFSRASSDARSHAEFVSQVFMGTRLQCANCHNHPLDRWTQDDYHGLAAVFARIERGQIVRIAARGDVTNVRTGEPAIPRIPGTRYLGNDVDARQAFADWLVSSDNPYFAKAFVNRLWRGMFGRGLIEPADDIRDTNPATHPELLDRFAQDFVEHKYSLRHALRRIATSQTYGRSSLPNAKNRSDDRFYSHALQRPLEPEVYVDALVDVTVVLDKYGDEEHGTRAIHLVDPTIPSESLDLLGRCSRRGSCEGVAASGALPAKLHQLNGDLINRKVTSSEGVLDYWIQSNAKDAEIVEDFYWRALSRKPSNTERDYWMRQLSELNDGEKRQRFEDFLWSLLNCSEFASNH